MNEQKEGSNPNKSPPRKQFTNDAKGVLGRLLAERENRRGSDEFVVANQLMALAGASSSKPVYPDLHTFTAAILAIPRENYVSPYAVNQEGSDRPDRLPKDAQEQIQMEHSYCIDMVAYENFLQEERDLRKNSNSSERLRAVSENLKAICAAGEKLEEEKKRKTRAKTKRDESHQKEKEFEDKKGLTTESKDDNEHVHNEKLLSMYISRVNADENKINFNKKLRIVLKDCVRYSEDVKSQSSIDSNISDQVASKPESSHLSDIPLHQNVTNSVIDASKKPVSLSSVVLRSSRHMSSKKDSLNESMNTAKKQLSDVEEICLPPPKRRRKKSVKKAEPMKKEIVEENLDSDKPKVVLNSDKQKKVSLSTRSNKELCQADNSEEEPKIGMKNKLAALSESSPSGNSLEIESKISKNCNSKKKLDSALPENAKLEENSGIDVNINVDQKKKHQIVKKISSHHVRKSVETKKKKSLIKDKKSISLSNKLLKSNLKTNNLHDSLSEKKKKNSLSEESSDAKLTTPEKLKVLDYPKDSGQITPNLPKSHKKKIVKRESARRVFSEDEPPLFSSPDVMIKVNTDEFNKKEIKDVDNKKVLKYEAVELKEDLKDSITETGFRSEVIDNEVNNDITDNVDKRDIIDSVNKKNITDTIIKSDITDNVIDKEKTNDIIKKDIFELEAKKTISDSEDKNNIKKTSEQEKQDKNSESLIMEEEDKKIVHEEKLVKKQKRAEFKEDLTKKTKGSATGKKIYENDTKPEVKSIVLKEQKNKEIKDLLSKDDTLLQEKDLFEISDSSLEKESAVKDTDKSKSNSSNKLSDDKVEKNTLKSAISEEIKNDNSLNILESEDDDFAEQDISDLCIDMSGNEDNDSEDKDSAFDTRNSINEGNSESVLSKDDNSQLEIYNAAETDNFDEQPKPERKSRRRIKKKEFFEYVYTTTTPPPITPPPEPPKKKGNTKQKNWKNQRVA